MYILRSSYLPLYSHQIIRPFTSDPFPSSAPTPSSPSPAVESTSAVLEHDVTPIISTQRETAVLDLFIVIRARQDMRSDESDLYLDNEDDRYRDMFNFMQPKARLEDLVHKYGIRYNLISLPTPPSSTPSTALPTPTPSYTTIPVPPASPSSPIPPIVLPTISFSDLSVTYGNRAVSLTARDAQGKRHVLSEVQRSRETLEVLARGLVNEWWRREKEEQERAAVPLVPQSRSRGTTTAPSWKDRWVRR
ncbi:hypothetical protein DL93DRAFT_2089117 [Clavulina sp. PMI_390]|nr:hypothetical protein DL93DRAFT_2089117 [Clavulina sp. PMI_390]